jgi:hypothetical protein
MRVGRAGDDDPLDLGIGQDRVKALELGAKFLGQRTGDLGAGIDQGHEVQPRIGGGVAGVHRPHPSRAQLRHLDHRPLPNLRVVSLRLMRRPRSILV